jgi:hypothetical protein
LPLAAGLQSAPPIALHFRKGFDLEQRVAAVEYRIESVPAYAPHAAWLIARDGEISTALAGLESLIALDGLASVEPQMLRPVSRR